MSLSDWFEIGGHLARLLALLASPVFALVAWSSWNKGKDTKAIYFMAWAIFAGITPQ